MKKVVFVCRGNVIRSQISKAIYNKFVHDGSVAESYGTDVEKDGNEGIELSKHDFLSNLIFVMKEVEGLDISQETSKQFKPEVLLDNPKVVFMCSKEKIPDWIENYPYEYWQDCLNEKEVNKDFNLNLKVPKFGDIESAQETIKLMKGKVMKLLQTNKPG